MTPSVLMCSTSHKRDFTQGNTGFFFRVQEDFSVSAEAQCHERRSHEKKHYKDLTETGKRVI